MKKIWKIRILSTTLIASALFASVACGQANSNSEIVAVEVVENGTLFLPDAEPLDVDGIPLYGGEFVTQGYLYPQGTVTCNEANECNGVLEDGSPEFPDEVIGTWVCRGWHVADGATVTEGPMVISTQTFILGDDPTASQIVSDGYELAQFNEEFERAITGGTGPYQQARGQQIQEFLGWNSSIGVVLSVELNVSP